MTIAVGQGEAIGHHGEVVQGIFEDDEAQLRRGLVSLPCRHLRSRATFTPNSRNEITANRNGVTVFPEHCEKARRAAELALVAFAHKGTGGHLSIETNVPVGRGMGSSTADVLASILAVVNYLEMDVSTEQVMRVAIDAETACDSTLFREQAVLFAHRDGLVIEPLKKALPPIDFLSIDTTPGNTVDTLEFTPADYNRPEIEAFRPLRGLLRQAVKNTDAKLLGRIATASARINERFLPKPKFSEISAIGKRHGAVGIQVAHSGTVAGLMFDSTDDQTPHRMELAARELSHLEFESKAFCR